MKEMKQNKPIIEIFVDEDSQFYDEQFDEIILGIQRIRTIEAFTQVVVHEYVHFVIHTLEEGNAWLQYDNIPKEWVLDGEIG